MIKCKNCAGNVKYDIESGKMLCKYCNSYFDPYEFDYDEADAEENTIQKDSYDEQKIAPEGDASKESFLADDTGHESFLIDDAKPKTYNVTIYTCPECAGEIISEENEAATFCSFCGASTVLASRISETKRPSSIIPFKITKEQCKDLYRKRMKKAIYAPNYYRDETYIDSFRGIYMPYWIFNVTQNNHVSLKGKKHYKRGNYRYEEEYSIDLDLDGYYDGISHDASASFADNISGAIAPYDHTEAVKFTPAFLSGFYADTTDVDSCYYIEDAEELANKTATFEIKYSPEVSGINVNFSSKSETALYDTRAKCREEAMYPVWFISHRHGDRVTYATVNGATGKIAADIPIDIKKYLTGSMLVAIPIFILLMILPTFVPQDTLIVSTILLFVGFITVLVQKNKVSKKEKNVGDKGMLKRAQNNTDETPSSRSFASVLFSILAFIIAVFVLVTKPLFDVYYYGAASLGLIASIVSYIVVIDNYNMLSTRKLPQFYRKGGDDRA